MADGPSQYPALKWVRLGPGQGKEEGKGSENGRRLQALDAWREKAWKKGLKRPAAQVGAKGATFHWSRDFTVIISPLFAVTPTNSGVNS
jgi:hypothetical protein